MGGQRSSQLLDRCGTSAMAAKECSATMRSTPVRSGLRAELLRVRFRWSIRPRSEPDAGQREADPAQRPVLVAVVGPAPVARVEQGYRGQTQGPAGDQAGVADRMQPTGRHLHDLAGPVPRRYPVGADGPSTPVATHPGVLTGTARPDGLVTHATRPPGRSRPAAPSAPGASARLMVATG